MSDFDEESGPSRFIGWLLVACGVMPVLGGLGIEPFSEGNVNGVPNWVPIVAGGVFIAAGISLLLKHLTGLAELFGIAAAAGLGAVGSWIAFGIGRRNCTGNFFFSWWEYSGALADLPCRLAFGWGAVLTDIFVLLMVVMVLKKGLGERPWIMRTKKGLEWLMLLVLAPLLLFMLVLLLFSSGRKLLIGWLKRRFTGKTHNASK